LLITFQLHGGRVPAFVGRYLPYGVPAPFGAGICYLGISKAVPDEYLPETVEPISEARFYELLDAATITTRGADLGVSVALTAEEKRAIGAKFLAGYVADASSSTLVDWHTGRSIDKTIHEYAGVSEEIGILRDQIVRMLNGDMTPSEEFSRLNTIAIAAIEAGRLEKEALRA
jgi:hypothetical protein